MNTNALYNQPQRNVANYAACRALAAAASFAAVTPHKSADAGMKSWKHDSHLQLRRSTSGLNGFMPRSLHIG